MVTSRDGVTPVGPAVESFAERSSSTHRVFRGTPDPHRPVDRVCERGCSCSIYAAVQRRFSGAGAGCRRDRRELLRQSRNRVVYRERQPQSAIDRADETRRRSAGIGAEPVSSGNSRPAFWHRRLLRSDRCCGRILTSIRSRCEIRRWQFDLPLSADQSRAPDGRRVDVPRLVHVVEADRQCGHSAEQLLPGG